MKHNYQDLSKTILNKSCGRSVARRNEEWSFLLDIHCYRFTILYTRVVPSSYSVTTIVTPSAGTDTSTPFSI